MSCVGAVLFCNIQVLKACGIDFVRDFISQLQPHRQWPSPNHQFPSEHGRESIAHRHSPVDSLSAITHSEIDPSTPPHHPPQLHLQLSSEPVEPQCAERPPFQRKICYLHLFLTMHAQCPCWRTSIAVRRYTGKSQGKTTCCRRHFRTETSSVLEGN